MNDSSLGLPAGPTDDTRLSLLERAKANDQQAWARLVELYSPLVFSWSLRRGLSRDDAGDIVQEVFSKVAVRLADFRRDRNGDTFRGWLRIVCRNQITDRFRKIAQEPAARGGSTMLQMTHQVVDDHTDETDATNNDDSLLFHRGLDLIRGEFEPNTWNAFWRTAVDGQTAPAVAEELGMTPGAVRQAKYKVLRRLRSEFEGLID